PRDDREHHRQHQREAEHDIDVAPPFRRDPGAPGRGPGDHLPDALQATLAELERQTLQLDRRRHDVTPLISSAFHDWAPANWLCPPESPNSSSRPSAVSTRPVAGSTWGRSVEGVCTFAASRMPEPGGQAGGEPGQVGGGSSCGTQPRCAVPSAPMMVKPTSIATG